MKKTFCKVISILLLITMLFSTGIASLTSLAASEADYKATFSIVTDKTSVDAGENVTVSIKLKTNYYIFSMQVPVIYNGDVFEVQNISAASNKAFLTFQGQLATAYRTNGNWKSPADFYTNRNTNSSYWSKKEVMDKYKIVFASWAADTTLNSGKAVKLTAEETIVSFVLKAKKDVKNIDGLIFLSNDFIKTDNFAGGLWFCGRSVKEKIDVKNYVAAGQTIEFTGTVPTQEDVKTEEGTIAITYKATANLKEQLAANIIKDFKLKWESADETIVTVDEDGNIYGAKAGTTTVTVKSDNGKFAKTFDVTVSYSVWQWIIIIVLFGWIWYV